MVRLGGNIKLTFRSFCMSVVLILLSLGQVSAQSGLCDLTTPFYRVDLSAQPNASYVSPQDSRKGNCCGTSSPDRCIEFEVTLHPNALGISFDIYSGAVPSGSMFYQIDCGPPIPVGQPVCLSGTGPHTVTFCKPGNNPNAYIIRSIPPPYQAPDNEVRIGCSVELETDGLIPNTISWSDVTSGTGIYDSLLSCLSGCSTTYFSPVPGTPAYVDYQVCGSIYDSLCNGVFTICDTLRVYVYPELDVPDLDTVYYCITDGGITIQGQASGGFGNYEYFWYDSSGNLLGNASSYFASSPGLYQLEIRDDLYPSCPADLQNFMLLPDAPATVNAGLDTLICSAAPLVSLDGSYSNVSGIVWSGGNGTYGQPTTTLNNTYTPTSAEVNAASVILTLSSLPDTACPVATDQKIIQFREPPELALVDAGNISCFGSADGFINVNTTNGTPPYVFNWSDGSSTEDISGLDTGYYELQVTDGLGCSDVIGLQITQPTILTGTISSTNVDCAGNNNGTVSTSITGGVPPYTYAWNTGDNQPNLTGLAGGNYAVTITDSSGCSVSLNAAVAEPTELVLALDSAYDLSCHGSNDGAIQILVAGGTTPYTFEWSNGAASQNLSSLAAGTYSLTLTDANGCSQNLTTTITEPAVLTGFITANYVSCYGGSDGNIDFSPSGGTQPYTYNWSNGATTQDLLNIPAGTYIVTMTDAHGCTFTNNRTIIQPDSIAVSYTSVNASCFGATDASINVSVSGGFFPYTYRWSNNATTQDLTNIPAGNYTLTVTDNTGCTRLLSVTISQPAEIVLTYTTLPASCNGGLDGAVDLTTTGGSAPYQYRWSTGATTQDISNVAAGNYTVTVQDANGCSTTAVAIVSEPNSILPMANVTANVSCYGGSNGAIDLNVSGGQGSYNYSWSNSSTTQDISNLPAGTYYVTVSDHNNCRAITSATIQQPAELIATTLPLDISCNNANDGSIDLNITGGVTPYSVNWSNGSSTEDISNLAAGTYTVTVTDSNSCVVLAVDSIDNPTPLTASMFKTDVTCNGGSNGFMEVNPSGGTPPYTFAWANGSTLPFLFGLSAGNYTVTLTDARGCAHVYTYSINEPAPISITGVTNDVSCFGGSNGTIIVRPAGGTSPYNYSWSNGASGTLNSGLTIGTYTVTVTDANGCSRSGSFTIDQPDSLQVITTVVHVGCNGASAGSISSTVSGGTSPYTYAWSTGATSASINNLQVGQYTLTVTDAKGCTRILTRNVLEPQPLVATLTHEDILCFGSNNGSITSQVTGGTAPYTYLWSNGATTQNLLNLMAGNYGLTVTDANGCQITGQESISQPALLTVAGTKTDLSCYMSADGAIDVTVTGGTTPYTYSWLHGPNSQDLTALAVGDYYLTVTDANGCEAFFNTSLTQPTEVKLNAISDDASCNGIPDGNIDLNVSGGVPGYTYIWSTGDSTQDLNNIPAGAYEVTVTDAIGCTKDRYILVNEPSNLQIAAQTDHEVSCFGGNDGSVVLGISGPVGVSQITWSNGSNAQDIDQLTAGNYYVTVTDVNGCRIIDAAMVNEPAPLNVIPDIHDVTCNGAADGYVSVSVSGGTNPYQYDWMGNGTGTVSDPLDVGSYTLVVSDSAGCMTTLNYAIVEPDVLMAVTTPLLDVSCPGQADGLAMVSVSGGRTPYNFNWSNGNTADTATALAAGVHTVTVTDSSGCTDVKSVTIAQPTPIVLATDVDHVSCFGGINGRATVLASGGSAPFSYSWSTGDTTTQAQLLPAGTYTVTVTDSRGCYNDTSATVTEPTAMSHLFDVTNVNCYDGQDGSIDIAISGGTAPYIFDWSNGATGSYIDSLTVGNYRVTVTDSNGCNYVTDTTLNQPDSLVVVVSSRDITCFGANNGSAGISITGGSNNYTYLWSNQQTTPSVFGLSAGSYTYEANDGAGCTIAGTVNIHEPDSLVANTDGTALICEGASNGSISVIPTGGTGPYSYVWSNSTTDSLNTGLATGTYDVTVSDSNNCVASSSFTINELINQMSLSANQACVNDTIDFAGATNVDSAIVSWHWTFGDGDSAASQLTNHIYATDGTMPVTLIIESNSGCIDTLADQVTVNALPAVDAGPTQTICPGDTAELVATANNINSFSWGPATLVSTPSTLATQAYPTDTTIFSVLVTDVNGCVNLDKVQVNVAPLPPANAGPDTIMCYGDTISLQATGGQSYTWLTNTNTLSCDTCANAQAYNTQDATYVVEVTSAEGCTNMDSMNVKVQPLPGGITAQQAGICQRTTATLSGPVGPYTYQWSPANMVTNPSGQTVNSAALDTTTQFSLLTSDMYGCQKEDSVTIAVFPVPQNYVTDSYTICQGDTVAIGAPGGLNNTWLNTDNLSCQFCDSALAYPGQTTVYPVRSLTSTGCIATDTVTVHVNIPDPINMTDMVTTCPGNTVILPGPEVLGATYTWSPATGLSNPHAQQPVVTLNDDQTYQLELTDMNGCTATDSVTYRVINKLAINLANDTIICLGEGVDLWANSIFNLTSPTDLVWYNSQGRALQSGNHLEVTPDENVTYSIVASSGSCEPDTAHVTVRVQGPPSVSFNEVDPVIDSATVTLQVSPQSHYLYEWSTDTSCIGCTSMDAVVTQTSSFAVTVTDNLNCRSEASITIPVFNYCHTAVYIPNSFSPNNDGKNDLFGPRSILDFNIVDFRIFDRWGNLVFEGSDDNRFWNGVYKGHLVNPGVFVYYLKVTCPSGNMELIKGNVTLLQ